MRFLGVPWILFLCGDLEDKFGFGNMTAALEDGSSMLYCGNVTVMLAGQRPDDTTQTWEPNRAALGDGPSGRYRGGRGGPLVQTAPPSCGNC